MKQEDLKSALLKKALGFSSDEVVEEYAVDEQGKSVLSKRKVTKKFNPPDLNALKMLLEEKQDDFSQMTDGQLLAEKTRLLQELGKLTKKKEQKK